VLVLAEGVTCVLAGDAEVNVGGHELRAGVHDRCPADLGVELSQPSVAPSASQRAEAELSFGLKAEDDWPTEQDRVVPSGERRFWARTALKTSVSTTTGPRLSVTRGRLRGRLRLLRG
jgi:hypothetical protein